MQNVSKKIRVLSSAQVRQAAGGVAIKAGVRAGLITTGIVVGTSPQQVGIVGADGSPSDTNAKMIAALNPLNPLHP